MKVKREPNMKWFSLKNVSAVDEIAHNQLISMLTQFHNQLVDKNEEIRKTPTLHKSSSVIQ